MHIMHIALGGCLKAPPVHYGITQDTGGHIAYVLGAAAAQLERHPGSRVTIVTRAFDDSALGAEHGDERTVVAPRLVIRRLRTANPAYLTKGALARELPALRMALLERVSEDAPDVIHAHFADAAELAFAVRRRDGTPVLYTPHSLGRDKPTACDDRRDRTATERLERETRAIRGADAIVVSSNDERHGQIGRADVGALARTFVARPGVEPCPSAGTALAEALIDPFLQSPDRPALLAVARPVRKKNLPRLVEAYASSRVLRSTANLIVIAGQHERIRAERDEQAEELDRLHALVSAHRLEGRVALPPSHAPETVTQLYRLTATRGGVFVNPAMHEPFGLTLIEAARFGLPVVATCNGGPRDIVADLRHGRLVEPSDRAAIARACEALLEHPEEYAAASRAALERNGLYRWSAWADTVAGVIEGTVGRRPSTTRKTAPIQRTAVRGATAIATCRSRTGRRAADRLAFRRHFLGFDIDDTLTGCEAGAERFGRWMSGRPVEALPFAVVTGRELPEARRVMADWRLPSPDVWITSVGTEIWRPTASDRLALCGEWSRRLSSGWNRQAIVAALPSDGVEHQGPNTQRRFKISLFGDRALARRLDVLLRERAFDVRVIASHGRFIDIVPQRAGKAAAIEFEARRRGIDMAQCVAAGNSGNDVDMLIHCGKAIVVANALPEIGPLGDREGLYRASEGHANGVLEGLAAFGLREDGERTRGRPILTRSVRRAASAT